MYKKVMDHVQWLSSQDLERSGFPEQGMKTLVMETARLWAMTAEIIPTDLEMHLRILCLTPFPFLKHSIE